MTTTLTLSDLKPGQDYFLDNVRVTHGRDNDGPFFRFGLRVIPAHDPAFAQATIRRVPREFKVGDKVTHVMADGDIFIIRAVDGDQAWVRRDSREHNESVDIQNLRHADEVAG